MEEDFVFTVRRIRDGAFRPEPGANHFLSVPRASTDIHPAHRQSSKASWVRAVMEAAQSGTNPVTGVPRGDIVFYVHGFNNDTRAMLDRKRQIAIRLRDEGFGGVVVAFDWPSASSALNYLEDRSDAKETARRLVDEGITAFAALQTPDCEINVHVLAHSMGAYVVREAFDDADDRPAVAARSWAVSQVILLSGDISAQSMTGGNPKSSSLYRHAVRVTNYQNPFDATLSLSNVKRVGVAPRVGRVGLPASRPASAVNVNCGAYYKEHEDRFGALEFPSHTWYFHDQALMRDIFLTLSGEIDRNSIPGRTGGDSTLAFVG